MPIGFNTGPTPPLASVNLETVETRLQAINLMLYAAGYARVETEDGGDLDTADASNTLATVSQRVQYNNGKGWWFNVEPNWKMTPDANGEILTPNNTISAWQDVRHDDLKHNITLRGRNIYDLNGHTFDMRPLVNKQGYLGMVFMLNLPFEHMPISARQAIAYQSVVEFMLAKEFDAQKIQLWLQLATQLQTNLGMENSRQESMNIFVNNATQANFGNMAGGPNARASFSRNPWNGYGGYHRNGRY